MNFTGLRLIAFGGVTLGVVVLAAVGASPTLVAVFLILVLIGVFLLGIRS